MVCPVNTLYLGLLRSFVSLIGVSSATASPCLSSRYCGGSGIQARPRRALSFSLSWVCSPGASPGPGPHQDASLEEDLLQARSLGAAGFSSVLPSPPGSSVLAGCGLLTFVTWASPQGSLQTRKPLEGVCQRDGSLCHCSVAWSQR